MASVDIDTLLKKQPRVVLKRITTDEQSMIPCENNNNNKHKQETYDRTNHNTLKRNISNSKMPSVEPGQLQKARVYSINNNEIHRVDSVGDDVGMDEDLENYLENGNALCDKCGETLSATENGLYDHTCEVTIPTEPPPVNGYESSPENSNESVESEEEVSQSEMMPFIIPGSVISVVDMVNPTEVVPTAVRQMIESPESSVTNGNNTSNASQTLVNFGPPEGSNVMNQVSLDNPIVICPEQVIPCELQIIKQEILDTRVNVDRLLVDHSNEKATKQAQTTVKRSYSYRPRTFIARPNKKPVKVTHPYPTSTVVVPKEKPGTKIVEYIRSIENLCNQPSPKSKTGAKVALPVKRDEQVNGLNKDASMVAATGIPGMSFASSAVQQSKSKLKPGSYRPRQPRKPFSDDPKRYAVFNIPVPPDVLDKNNTVDSGQATGEQNVAQSLGENTKDSAQRSSPLVSPPSTKATCLVHGISSEKTSQNNSLPLSNKEAHQSNIGKADQISSSEKPVGLMPAARPVTLGSADNNVHQGTTNEETQIERKKDIPMFKLVTRGNKTAFECPKCSKVCVSMQGLDIHYRSAHDRNEMPHHCEICTRGFFCARTKESHKYNEHRMRPPLAPTMVM